VCNGVGALTLRIMCIIYFAVHRTCNHYHFLGCGNCSLDCTTDARHTFLLDDNGFECATCVFLRGEELDPEVAPVAYYPPLFDVDKLPKKEEKQKGYVPSAASLSDLDSETSEWRRDADADEVEVEVNAGCEERDRFTTQVQQDTYTPTRHVQQDVLTPTRHVQQNAYSPAPQNTFPYPQVTPKTAAHRNLIHDQLKTLPFGGQMVQPHVAPLLMGLLYVPSGWHTTTGSQPRHVPGGPTYKGKEKM
jgi:hypothetical protein